MHLLIRKKTVHYRKWGVPETKIRAMLYVDGTMCGTIMAVPIVADKLIDALVRGINSEYEGVDSVEIINDE